MTAPRRVSVVVPTRDRQALLRVALASIRALEAADVSFEILVGDNGLSDETKRIAEEFGAKYLPVTEHGAGAARNAGLRAATGDYLAFLDDDDAWMIGHLRPQLDMLDADPALDAVIGRVIYTDKNMTPISAPWPENPPSDREDMLRRMMSGWFPQIGTFVGRIRVRELSGEFDQKLIGGQDLDWMLRTARRRTLGFTQTPCVLFRGRDPGTYDLLQHRRIGFDRKVFLRHALPEWRVWRSPAKLARAYSGTLMHFYVYFSDAAAERAANGRRGEAFKAMRIAFGVFPLRGMYHLVKPRTSMQRALVRILAPPRNAARAAE
jgi:glycosyltransferase involved in cell wall biosynthesis